MAATLSNPQISAAITSGMAGGALPATATGSISDGTARGAVVGSGAGQVNKIYSAAFTVTSGTPFTIDLTTLTDLLGNAITFGTYIASKITNLSVTTGQDFTCFGGTNGLLATSTELCYANGGNKLHDTGTTGITVDSTHKIIQITVAAGTSVAGTITVIGK